MSLFRYYYAPSPVAQPSYEDGVLSLSPVGYWPLDEASGNFADATGNGWTATVSGSPTYQSAGPTIGGVAQVSAYFDGSNDWASVSTNIDDNVTTEMTLSVWFRIPAAVAAQELCSMYTSGDISWRTLLGTSGEPSFYTYQTDGATLHAFVGPGTGYDDDAWHHLVAWKDSNGYVNINVDGGTLTSQDNTLSGTWNGPTTAGMSIAALTTTGSSKMTGYLAHLAYWDSDIGSTARTSLYTGSF